MTYLVRIWGPHDEEILLPFDPAARRASAVQYKRPPLWARIVLKLIYGR